MRSKKLDNISCPKCGYEYLPVEIFIPDSFFGKPYDILRDDNGKILSVVGNESAIFDEYICDKCNTKFRVRAKVTFATDISKTANFNESYVTDIHKESLTLVED